MAHRFLHTLVFSSVMALEGCADSHDAGPLPDPFAPDGSAGDARVWDARVRDARVRDAIRDAGARDANRGMDSSTPAVDAGPPPFDGGSTNVDAGDDAGPSVVDAGNDAAPNLDGGQDAGPSDPRFCEPGWQTTKASHCEPLDPTDPNSILVCYNSFYCFEEIGEDGETTTECREATEDDFCLLEPGS